MKCKSELENISKSILVTEQILSNLKETFDQILQLKTWPLEIRAFIFEKKVKNMFMFSEDVLAGT